jgi:predicted DNA-binding antitoxin AbrB/MazE fold protein
MISQIEAVFENGLFRPLEPVPLANAQQVTLTISDSMEAADITLDDTQWRQFSEALDRPARMIPSLRKLLSEPGVFDGPDAAQ